MSALEFSKPFGASLLIVLGFGEAPRAAQAAGSYWLRRVDVEPVIDYLVDLARRAGRPVVHVVPPGGHVTGAALAAVAASQARGAGPPLGSRRADDLVFVREGLSAFDATGLDRIVAGDEVRRALIVGDADARTMSATIEDAAARGLSVAVVPDALMSGGPDEARALTRSLRRQGVATLRARDAWMLPTPSAVPEPVPESGSSGEISWVTRTAALAAFADEVSRAGGYASAHVARVARDCRLSLRTFYDAYPGGKVDCFVALYRYRAQALDRAIRAAVRETPDPHARAELALLVAVRAVVSDQPLSRALLYEFPALAEGAAMHEATLDSFVSTLEQLLPADARTRATGVAIRGVIGGLIALALSPRVDEDDVDEIVSAVRLMLDGILQESAAR